MGRLPSILVVIAGLLMSLVPECSQGDDAATLADLIDGYVAARLESEGLSRAAPADDAEFLRRIFLDLHGVVPSSEQTASFLEGRDPEKRARLIQELLASPRFGEHFGDLWRGRLISPLASDQRKQS